MAHKKETEAAEVVSRDVSARAMVRPAEKARLEALPKDKTRVVGIRLERVAVARLEALAIRSGMSVSQLVRSWIYERLNQ